MRSALRRTIETSFVGRCSFRESSGGRKRPERGGRDIDTLAERTSFRRPRYFPADKLSSVDRAGPHGQSVQAGRTRARFPPLNRRSLIWLILAMTVPTSTLRCCCLGAAVMFSLIGPLSLSAEDIASPSVDISSELRRGNQLAREGKYREALEAWTEAYLRKLPDYRALEFRRPVESPVHGSSRASEVSRRRD